MLLPAFCGISKKKKSNYKNKQKLEKFRLKKCIYDWKDTLESKE